jgi:hypothetical protein
MRPERQATRIRASSLVSWLRTSPPTRPQNRNSRAPARFGLRSGAARTARYSTCLCHYVTAMFVLTQASATLPEAGAVLGLPATQRVSVITVTAMFVLSQSSATPLGGGARDNAGHDDN